MDAVNYVEAELFHLHANPIFSLDSLVFDDFTKLLSIFPMMFCLSLGVQILLKVMSF